MLPIHHLTGTGVPTGEQKSTRARSQHTPLPATTWRRIDNYLSVDFIFADVDNLLDYFQGSSGYDPTDVIPLHTNLGDRYLAAQLSSPNCEIFGCL